MKQMKCLMFTGLLVLGTTSTIYGAVSLRISDGTTTITVADQSLVAPIDASTAAGVVAWTGVVGNWVVAGGTGQGTAILGQGNLDLSFAGTSGASAPDLIIEFSETGLTGQLPLQLAIGGTSPSGDTTFEAFWSNTDTLFAATTLIGSVGPFNATSYNQTFNGTGTSSGTYSLTERITLHATGGATTHAFSGNASLLVQPVPEPTSIFLLGTVLLFAGKKLRSRFRSDNPTNA